jgi:hypothetical protein
MNLSFNEENHTYTIDGKIVPSVTQIIKETVGGGWSASEWYLTRGKAIHLCATFIAQGKEFKYDERLAGYVKALRKFFYELEPFVIGSEMAVGSQLYQFAGTLDLVCKIGGRKYIADYKHSIDKIRIPLQVGGYSQAYKETTGEEINFGIGIEIRENGTYSATDTIGLKIPRNEFLALRTAYRIRERCGELTSQRKDKSNG